MSVAQAGYFGIQVRTDDEVGAILDIESRCRSIDNGAGSENHFGAFPPGVLDYFPEDVEGEVSPVGELEGADAAFITSLDDLATDGCVRMIEDRDDAGGRYRL